MTLVEGGVGHEEGGHNHPPPHRGKALRLWFIKIAEIVLLTGARAVPEEAKPLATVPGGPNAPAEEAKVVVAGGGAEGAPHPSLGALKLVFNTCSFGNIINMIMNIFIYIPIRIIFLILYE